jgi:hypothetical protein
MGEGRCRVHPPPFEREAQDRRQAYDRSNRACDCIRLKEAAVSSPTRGEGESSPYQGQLSPSMHYDCVNMWSGLRYLQLSLP